MTQSYTDAGDPRVNPADPYDTHIETDPAAERSLLDDVRALIDDGKMVAEAELDFQKKRVAYGAGQAGGIVGRFGAAAVVALLAGIGFTVGLIIALGTLITIWGSTAVVTLVYLLVALGLAKSGQKRLRHVQTVISTTDRTESR
ncbi:phage holin family protein [Croceicoccus hydrothermalis]|uniref:phage holin family protein n=1 Tax=Croceicoccus hydrothermalis TaxID=2867964 RepID=UPI001EFB232E|nr:phage holin family protein [Croceicoccus hydrothermalis]